MAWHVLAERAFLESVRTPWPECGSDRFRRCALVRLQCLARERLQELGVRASGRRSLRSKVSTWRPSSSVTSYAGRLSEIGSWPRLSRQAVSVPRSAAKSLASRRRVRVQGLQSSRSRDSRSRPRRPAGAVRNLVGGRRLCSFAGLLVRAELAASALQQTAVLHCERVAGRLGFLPKESQPCSGRCHPARLAVRTETSAGARRVSARHACAAVLVNGESAH